MSKHEPIEGRHVASEFDVVFGAVIALVPSLGWSVLSQNRKEGVVVARSGLSFHSWGERITIRIVRVDDQCARVSVATAPIVGFSLHAARLDAANRSRLMGALDIYLRALREAASRTNVPPAWLKSVGSSPGFCITRTALEASLLSIQARVGMLNARSRWRSVSISVAMSICFWVPWAMVFEGMWVWIPFQHAFMMAWLAARKIQLEGGKLRVIGALDLEYSLDDVVSLTVGKTTLTLRFAHAPDGTASKVSALAIDLAPEILSADGF